VREEIERLEDETDRAADSIDIDTAGGDVLPGDEDAAAADRLDEVDAAKQRRLARAGGADQTDDLWTPSRRRIVT
jgi:hypothetical protein